MTTLVIAYGEYEVHGSSPDGPIVWEVTPYRAGANAFEREVMARQRDALRTARHNRLDYILILKAKYGKTWKENLKYIPKEIRDLAKSIVVIGGPSR